MKRILFASLMIVLLPALSIAQGSRNTSHQRGAGGGSSYCTASHSIGTQLGDFIDGVVLEGISNTSSGGVTNLDYTDYTYGGSNFMTKLTIYSNYSIAITSGTWGSDDLIAWIDFNGNDEFEDSEMLGQVTTTGPSETVNMPFVVPGHALPGYQRMRVMCTYNPGTDPDPCAIGYEYGEVEDYIVVLEQPGDCIPLFSVGNSDGDFIGSLSLAGMVDMSYFPGIRPYQPAYKAAHIMAGTTYDIDIVGGDYDDDNFSVWVDWNYDGDYDDANEMIGDHRVSSVSEMFAIPLTVPTGIFGWYDMRVICADIINIVPCPDADYGESRQYKLVIDNPNLPCYSYNYFGNTPPWGGTHMIGVSVNGNALNTNWISPYHKTQSTDDPTHVYPGDQLNVSINAGDMVTDLFQCYYDANADLSYGSSELVGSTNTTIANQVLNFSTTIPANSDFGIHFLRVGAYGVMAGGFTACDDPYSGVVLDIPIFVDDPNGPCTPAFNNWTRYGDFIDAVILNNLSNTNSGGRWGAHYTSYPASSFTTDVFSGVTYTMDITAGDYYDNDFHVWIDHNDDGDFDDPTEFIGMVSNTSGGQTMSLNYTVPSGIALGQRAMRVKCSTDPVADPCLDTYAGETEDYVINISSATTVEDLSENEFTFFVYDEQLIIGSTSGKLFSFTVYDMLGNSVLKGRSSGERTVYSLNTLAEGQYLVSVDSELQTAHGSVVLIR